MKKSISKILLGLGAIVCTFNANAQWTTTGTVIRPVTLTNNVSVGTTVNGANLYVEKATAVTLGIKSTTAGATMFMDKGSVGSNAAFAYRLGGVTQWNSGMLGGNNYSIRNVVANSFPIVVDINTDNVLLNSIGGTGTATYPLTVQTGPTIAIGLDNGASIFVKNNVGAYEPFLWPQWTDNKTYMNYGAGGFDIRNNGGTTAMFMSPTNNVGIGTSSPNSKLDVAGQTHIKFDDIPQDYTGSQAVVEIGPGSSYIPSITFLNNYSTTNGIKLYGSGGGTGLIIRDETGINAQPITASAFTVASDRTLKKDIVDISVTDYADYMEQIRNIESITYRYNYEVPNAAPGSNAIVREVPHVGFTAQTLPSAIQSKIPVSCKTSNDEYKLGYNLSDMAGLTLIGIKALDAKAKTFEDALIQKDAKIEAQQKQITALTEQMKKFESALSQCCSNFVPSTQKQETGSAVDFPSLQQNQPNPFNQNTIIRFSLASGSQNANIIIRDLNGGLVKQINVTKANNGQLVINALELKQGTYTYTLEVNGNSIDTKLMVVTK